MKDQRTFSAYRLPRLNIKSVVKSIVSVRKKSNKDFNEEAKEFILEVKSGLLTVYEIDFYGNRQNVRTEEWSKTDQAKLLQRRTYKDTDYVYHIMEEVTE